MNCASADPITQERRLAVQRLLLLRRVVAALPRTSRVERAHASRLTAQIDQVIFAHLEAIPEPVSH
jgi:hypothetical protein